MARTRIYQDCNITPLEYRDPANPQGPVIRNAPLYPVAAAAGVHDCGIMYDHIHNRMPLWLDENNYPRPEAIRGENWKGQEIQATPPHKEAVVGYANLIQTPGMYVKTDPKPYMPMVFDFENSTVAPGYGSEDWPRMAENVVNVGEWSKLAGDVGERWWFALFYDEAHDEFHDELNASGYDKAFTANVACLYNWNPTIKNPLLWYELADRHETMFRRYWPNMPKIAAVCPVYQVWWNDPSLSTYVNKSLNVGLLRQQIEYLINRGWQILFWHNVEFKADKDAIEVAKSLASYTT